MRSVLLSNWDATMTRRWFSLMVAGGGPSNRSAKAAWKVRPCARGPASKIRARRSALTRAPRNRNPAPELLPHGESAPFQFDDVESSFLIDSKQIDASAEVRDYLAPQQHERPQAEDRHVIGDDRLQALLFVDSFHDEGPRPVLFYPPQVHLYRHGSDLTAAAPVCTARRPQAAAVLRTIHTVPMPAHPHRSTPCGSPDSRHESTTDPPIGCIGTHPLNALDISCECFQKSV